MAQAAVTLLSGNTATSRPKHTVTGNVQPIQKTTAVDVGPVSIRSGEERARLSSNLASLNGGNNNNNSSYSSGSSSSGSGGDYYSGGGGASYADDILDKIKSLLTEQKEAADKYYNTLYDQRLNQINQEVENNRNLINKESMMALRRNYAINGKSDSGPNVTNQTRIRQNWLSNLAANRQQGANLRDSALASRDLGLSNNANTLAQGWYNYVLPVYTNRQNQLDDYAYRRYIASL